MIVVDGKKRKLKFKGKVIDLLRKLGISSQIVIVRKNGKIVTEMDEVSDKDLVEIITVVFGG